MCKYLLLSFIHLHTSNLKICNEVWSTKNCVCNLYTIFRALQSGTVGRVRFQVTLHIHYLFTYDSVITYSDVGCFYETINLPINR